MTGNKNIVLLVLVGIPLLGLGGCESQPYKPWQPGDSWWEKEQQTRKEAEGEKQMQASPPVMAAEPAVAQPMTRQVESAASVAPPRMTMEPETPPASANAPARTTGDVLLIDSIQSAPDIKTPRNGMSMASVRSQFGNPISEGSSIGDPPITRWEYKGFSVYFEHDLVLHSVTHRPNRN